VQQVRLSLSKEQHLVGWIEEKLQIVDETLDALRPRWQRWIDHYEGKVKPRSFPWPGCSNVHTHIIGSITDAIYANLVNRVLGHDRIWDVMTTKPTVKIGMDTETGQALTWGDAARALQEYLRICTTKNGPVDITDPLEDTILSASKLGTGVFYSPWSTITQPDYVVDPFTGEVRLEREVVIEDGIKGTMLSLEDFICLPNYDSFGTPDGSPIFGHSYYLRPGQVLARIKDGKYRRNAKVEESVGMPPSDDDTLKDHVARVEGDPHSTYDVRRDDYKLRNLWLTVQLAPGEPEVRLFVVYLREHRALLSIQAWPSRFPPYHHFRYLRREGRFYGVGVPELLELLQAGANTSFNQAVDNATVANMRCIKMRKGRETAKLSPATIYPGKTFYLDDMGDLEAFQLGEVYSSIFQVGLQFRDLMERRSGISDPNLGRESEVLGRGSTATSVLALLQESSRRFDLYSKDIRRAIGGIGVQILDLYSKHRAFDRVAAYMSPEQALLAQRALELPPTADLRELFTVTTTTAASSSNKEVARQNAVSVFSLLTQYLEKLFQAGSVMVNPQVPPELKRIAFEAAETGERVMLRILETFDMPDVVLPQLKGGGNGVTGPSEALAPGPGAMGADRGLLPGPEGGAAGLPALPGGPPGGALGGGGLA
jgi:hypothetical protein